MKKVLSLILAAFMVLALSACADTTGKKDKLSTPSNIVSDTVSNVFSDTLSGLESQLTPPVSSGSATISRDRAIEIALEKAGLTRDAVFDIDAELEREFGNLYWEIDFETREHEYSYALDAYTGAVARGEKEFND